MKKLVTFLLLVVLTLSSFGQTKTGTLKVFSELTGISVYLDDNKQGVDVKEVNGVPVGSSKINKKLSKQRRGFEN
jgi:hypothetical protein